MIANFSREHIAFLNFIKWLNASYICYTKGPHIVVACIKELILPALPKRKHAVEFHPEATFHLPCFLCLSQGDRDGKSRNRDE